MNLIKSFNFSLLKQNFRKSKGTIILSLIIVPLIISIVFLIASKRVNNPQIFSAKILGTCDCVFMYIIPYLYSGILFGYVFKKNSSDFINSMPVNRTTVFVTNTIGGIFLITCIQLLSGIFMFLGSKIFSNLIVFPLAIFEIMLVSWISYVFVFIVSNLAISFSGSFGSQFIIVFLILFLVPICLEGISGIRQANDYEYHSTISINNGYDIEEYDIIEPANYTMPFGFIKYFGFNFSKLSNFRMVVLSAVYFILGLIFYKKRKMESVEEFFSTQRLHMFVKSLTLIPIVLFVNLLYSNIDSYIIIVVAFCLTIFYYFIFDIVSKRKISLLVTISSFAISIVVMQVGIELIKNSDTQNKIININDIKAIAIGKNSNSFDSDYFNREEDTDELFDGNYFIKNNQLIEEVLANENYSVKNNQTIEDIFANENNSSYRNNFYFNIKLKNGKEYYLKTYISYEKYDKIKQLLIDDDNFAMHLYKKVCKTNGIIGINNKTYSYSYSSNIYEIIDRENKKLINKSLKENPDFLFETYYSNSNQRIEKMIYSNHRVEKYYIPIDYNEEVFSAVASSLNKKTIKIFNGDIDVNTFEAKVYDKEHSEKEILNSYNIIMLMKEYGKEKFDPSQKYYVIEGEIKENNNYKHFVFYTNRTKEFDDNLSNNRIKNNEEFIYYD